MFFALQRDPMGYCPVTFDERPTPDWDSAKDVVWSTLVPVPDRFIGESLKTISAHFGYVVKGHLVIDGLPLELSRVRASPHEKQHLP